MTRDTSQDSQDDDDTREPVDRGRRELLVTGTAAVAGGAALLGAPRGARASAGGAPGTAAAEPRALPPGQPGRDYTPVIVPNGVTLPWKLVGGVKVFHLVAEEVAHELVPGLEVRCWGYNGHVHGPVIEAVEGDRVRIYVTNRLPEPTTAHWHGVLTPNGMDGVGGLNQRTIKPGETFKYEFTLRQSGTLMYHSHHDEMTQMALGMTGMFIIHPRRRPAKRVDRDFVLLLHEWRVDPGAKRPDPNEMTEFNILTMNAKVYPATAPLVARTGERVRIRFGNLSAMDHHPIHLHGHHFNVVGTDAGEIPVSAQWPEATVLVPVGSTRTVEFIAAEPGDWAMHCHMTHHVMNQMGHGMPNLVGIDAAKVDARVQKVLPSYMTMGQSGMGDMAAMSGMPTPKNSVPMLGGVGKHDVITMGGMFTILKVRNHLASYADPGWYDNPAGTLASEASAGDLKRDGIDPGSGKAG
jgi:FtsP/CotA-like multicopper oxidase with cupredoxin domain